MSLLTFRDAIKHAIENEVGGLAAVLLHGGRFDVDELQRYVTQAPCAVVSPVGLRRIYSEGGQKIAEVQWAVVVITRDTKNHSRDAAALIVLEAVLNVVHAEQRFDEDDDNIHAPESIQAENLYSTRLDKLGVAMWGISWRQSYDINVLDYSTLDDFLHYRATTTLEGSLDDTETTQDAVDLDGPEEE